jgi:tetratricopeptide (TPR) repeat protein
MVLSEAEHGLKMWWARPIFISSTFLDMQAERDHLRTHVFPKLEDELREHRCFPEWIDLRVGVATASQQDQAARELHILKVCLTEVVRCRPFLIVLLGDRYGTVLPDDRVRAAATEAGFTADIAGRSLTELEIEYGILSDPEQQPRSFFYFREPLPYARMPAQAAEIYSDAFAADPATARNADRLTALKRRIEVKLPGRVRHYTLGWDDERQRVTGLSALADMVSTDIRNEIIKDTGSTTAALEISWQQGERNAVADFAEERARDFVGRADILEQLTAIALGAEAAERIWGACVTGVSGSGKSALFGELYRRLGASDVFLLAHAPGASVLAPSVDTMLRRWVTEIATELGVDPGLPEAAEPERVDEAFASLLGRMALRRRVIVLIDALDQFEATTRGQYLTWMPRLWPVNARLLMTTTPGKASEALREPSGITTVDLPPLDASEARDIITGVCRRYHREFEPEVIEALLAKRGSDGVAWGNPLWVVLAVEELNLLDADDFARAKRAYVGSESERLRALMIDMVAAFPADIPGLYAQTFERAEEVFGVDLARAFLGFITVGRAGWRESDFRALLPAATSDDWDELHFASLRRFFRGQMRRRGALNRWDFNHAQMRAAVRKRLSAQKNSEQQLHTMIADHLLACPADDPLRISEAMVHLLGSENWASAADYYADSELIFEAALDATKVIADTAISVDAGADKICRLLATSGRSDTTEASLAHRFIHLVLPALVGRATIDNRIAISAAVAGVLEAIVLRSPQTPEWLHDLATLNLDFANLMGDAGRPRETVELVLRQAMDMAKRVVALAPDNLDYERALTEIHLAMGDLFASKGQYDLARGAYILSHNMRKELAEKRAVGKDPQEPMAVQPLLDSCESCRKLGQLSLRAGKLDDAQKYWNGALLVTQALLRFNPRDTAWQDEHCSNLDGLGDTLAAAARYGDAFDAYSKSAAIRERLLTANPDNIFARRDVAISCSKIGDVLAAMCQYDEALRRFQKMLEINEELAASDPANIQRQRDVAVAHGRIANVSALGKVEDAGAAARKMLDILTRLAKADPQNAALQGDLIVGIGNTANSLFALGRWAEALTLYEQAIATNRSIATMAPTNATWQEHLSTSYMGCGNALTKLGRGQEAAEAYEQSLSIAEALLSRDPTNKAWRRRVVTACEKLGDAYAAVSQHDKSLHDKALKAYRRGLEVAETLAPLS